MLDFGLNMLDFCGALLIERVGSYTHYTHENTGAGHYF